MRIFDILPVGEENAIPGEEIERRLGITRRERRAMAAQELENGLFVAVHHHAPRWVLPPGGGRKRPSRAGPVLSSGTGAGTCQPQKVGGSRCSAGPVRRSDHT